MTQERPDELPVEVPPIMAPRVDINCSKCAQAVERTCGADSTFEACIVEGAGRVRLCTLGSHHLASTAVAAAAAGAAEYSWPPAICRVQSP